MKILIGLNKLAVQPEVKTLCIYLAEVKKEYLRAFEYYLFNDNKLI